MEKRLKMKPKHRWTDYRLGKPDGIELMGIRDRSEVTGSRVGESLF